MLVKNALAEDLANSFVLLARRAGTGGPHWTAPDLLYHYSADRRPEYAVGMSISGHGGDACVRRRRLFPVEPLGSDYHHRVVDERYIPGALYSEGLHRVVNFDGWTLEQLAQWAEPWVQYLRTFADSGDDGQALLPPELLDCIPLNLVRRADGTLSAFDLEFVPKEPPSLAYVVFRGLYAGLMWSGTCAKPAGVPPTGMADVAFEVMRLLGILVLPEKREKFIRQEARLQVEVRGIAFERAIQELQMATLQFRGVAPPAGPPPLGSPALLVEFARGVLHRIGQLPGAYVRLGAAPDRPLGRPRGTLVYGAVPTGSIESAGARSPLRDAASRTRWQDAVGMGRRSESLHGALRYDIEILTVSGSEGVMAHLQSDDPRMTLPFPESALEAVRGGGVFEVDFRWMGTLRSC